MPNVTDFLNNQPATPSDSNAQVLDKLDSIIEILRGSQSNARYTQESRRDTTDNQNRYTRISRDDFFDPHSRRKSTSRGSISDMFMSGFKKSLLDGLGASGMKEHVAKSLAEFSTKIGVPLEDIPGKFGEALGKKTLSAFKDSSFGKNLTDKLQSATSQFTGKFDSTLSSIGDKINESGFEGVADDLFSKAGDTFSGLGEKLGSLKDTALSGITEKLGSLGGAGGKLGSILGKLGGIFGNGASAASTVASGAATTATASTITTAATAVGPSLASLGTAAAGLAATFWPLIAVVGGIVILFKIFEPLFKGVFNHLKNIVAAGNRAAEEDKKRQELAKERYKKDIEEMVKYPFEIMQEAAEEARSVWKETLRTITATQGYTKASMQSMMAAYASRLEKEGLTSVLSSTDITSNLSKVIEGGLSGAVAEEFAYIATKLGAAIPTEDFFSYASSYGAIVGNAIQQGKSQAQALQEANRQLEQFASNLLYSSRRISNGINTGLADAKNLFDQATQIAVSARTYNAAQISAVTTAVAAQVGAIAPQLASSITDIVQQAATGGNTSEIVALRSLAGINASTTEFLQQFARDPQSIFSKIFENLGNLYQSNNAAYMERAEGLSQIFGLSMDAFAQIDFTSLAAAVRNIEVNTASLDENYKMLASGETTLSDTMLKYNEINARIAEEGYSYILESEVAYRMQQHLWDEQRDIKLMQNEYGVNLKGSSMELLESIGQTIQNILSFLNPIGLISKLVNRIVNIAATEAESEAQERDKQQLLNLVKVGNGNIVELSKLMNTMGYEDLYGAENNLVNRLGGFSAYESIEFGRNVLNKLSYSRAGRNALRRATNIGTVMSSAVSTMLDNGFQVFENLSKSSKYEWGTRRKSAVSNVLQGLLGSTASIVLGQDSTLNQQAKQLASRTQQQAQANLEKVNAILSESPENLAKIASYKSYQDWINAQGQGFVDLAKAVGYTESQLQQIYQEAGVQAGVAEQQKRNNAEQSAWDAMVDIQKVINVWDETTFPEWKSTIATKLDSIHDEQVDTLAHLKDPMDVRLSYIQSKLTDVYGTTKKFLDAWTSYYIEHEAYNRAYDASAVKNFKMTSESSTDSAINNLATALLGATDLSDPRMQTNALLAQIINILSAILQAQGSNVGLSLPDTFAGLALGLIGKQGA